MWVRKLVRADLIRGLAKDRSGEVQSTLPVTGLGRWPEDRAGWIAVKLLCAYSSIKRTPRKRRSVNLCLPKCFGYNAQTPSMQLSQR